MTRTEFKSVWRQRTAFAAGALVLPLCLTGCLHPRPRGAEIVAFKQDAKLVLRGDCHSLGKGCSPFKTIDAELYSSQRTDDYRQSGFITLKPNMRLRIVAPVMRQGSHAVPVTSAAGSSESQAKLEPQTKLDPHVPLAAQSSQGLEGYETAIYVLRAAANSAVTARLSGIELQPIGRSRVESLNRTDYLKAANRPAFLRLYFQLRHAPADHGSILLMSDSEGEMNEASGQLEAAPDRYCAVVHPHASCILFPPFTAVNAEIKVFVHKRPVYVPISATVSDALTAAGIADPATALKKLKVERIWDAHRVPVHFDRQTAAVLALPLVSGDRLSL